MKWDMGHPDFDQKHWSSKKRRKSQLSIGTWEIGTMSINA